jgi:hypothetical protein
MKKGYKMFTPLFVLFICINALIFIFRSFLEAHGFAIIFLAAANMLLFCVSFSGFFLQLRGLRSSKIHGLISGVYASLLIKIFIVIIALALYLFITKGKVNKPSLFASMAFYILYTFIEVKQLLKISRSNPNA